MTTTARAKNGPAFGRQRLPERFCNLDRLLADMEARELDGLVVTSALNVFYLTGFNGVAHKADEPRPYTLVLARREPEHPILVLADYYLTTPLYQPTWVKDIRPCRSVMSPVDLPATAGGHRRPHPALRGGHRVGGAGAGRLPVRERRADPGRDAGSRDRPGAGRLRRRGLRPAAGIFRTSRSRTVTTR